MTSGTYYHIQVTPQTEGYYQICYEVGSGNSSNRLYAYVNNTYQNLGGGSVSASTNSSKSGCQSLGYLSTSDTVRVVQQAYSSTSYGISTTSFRLERCSSLESHIGYRYEGKDPNNYIWFNNELWRIIGVFDSTSHGVSGQNLVKIIRNDSIGALAWHKSNTNDWTASNLMNLLNGAYLNSQNGTGGEYCYGYGYFSISSNCNYTETGINDAYRTMIENATWYLGGHSTHDATAESFYEYERGPSVYGERPTTWEGLIGLMYPSDYGYSVLASSCPRTRYLGSYNSPSCAGQSWIYGQGYEWTITPQSTSSDNVFDVGVDGPLSYYGNTYEGQNARPVLYLDPNVYVIDGDGSITDPYIIGM